MNSDEAIIKVREAISAINKRLDTGDMAHKGVNFEVKFSIHGQDEAIIVGLDGVWIRLTDLVRYPIKGTIDEAIEKELIKYNKKAENGKRNQSNASEIEKILDAAVIYFMRMSKEIKLPPYGVTFKRNDGKLTLWQFTTNRKVAPNVVRVEKDQLTNKFRIPYPGGNRKWKSPTQILDVIIKAIPELAQALSNPKFFEENVT